MAETPYNKPRIVIFDLETIPNLQEAMKVWCQLGNYPGLTLKATITTIICAGWKIYGQKKTNCINAWDFKAWKKNKNNDYHVVKGLYDVLKNADAVVTHNGKSFDWKFLQTRLMHHKLKPLGKIHHIDTKEVAKRHLFAFNNKLTTIGKLLVEDDKMKHEGWDMWVKILLNDNTAAKKKMTAYCKQDVLLLEKCFHQLRPFINNIPNHSLLARGERICPNCGSPGLHSHGLRRTQTQTYRRYRCLDCGTWCRTDKRGLMARTL